jgi:hypothetical protein
MAFANVLVSLLGRAPIQHILSEGLSCTKKTFFHCHSEKVGTDTLVGFSQLWKAGKQGRRRAVISAMKLTSVAHFEMGSNISIHTRPVIAHEKAFFCFIDAIVSNELVAMGVGESVLL